MERFGYLHGEKAVSIAEALNERLPHLKEEIYDFISLVKVFSPTGLYKVFSEDPEDEVHEAVMQLLSDKKFKLTETLDVAIS